MDIKIIHKELRNLIEKSPCKKRKVAAIIIKDNMILGRGYNYNSNKSDNCEDELNNTFSTVIHAEIAAIHNAKEYLFGQDLKNAKMYVTHPPCNNCKAAIEEEGMTYEVVNLFLKFDKDKPKYSLIPPSALEALATVLTYGAKKYKPNNWREVDDINRYVDASFRHLEAWRKGEKLDKESGLPHLWHLITNIAFLIELDKESK